MTNIVDALRSHNLSDFKPEKMDELADTIECLLMENKMLRAKARAVPCDVGDVIYRPWNCNGHKAVARFFVTKVCKVDKNNWNINYQSFYSKNWKHPVVRRCSALDFGKTVFLSVPM